MTRYSSALFFNETREVTQSSICSTLLHLKTYKQRKLALSNNDDKRYIIPKQQIDTLPWGHYKVPKSHDLILISRTHPQKFLIPPHSPEYFADTDEDDDASQQDDMQITSSLSLDILNLLNELQPV